jgi:hypothetical protein
MVYRGHCVLLDELRSKRVCSSLEDMVSILHQVWSSKLKLEELVKVVKAMLTAGSHYKNIEKKLGPGSWLVLGKVIPETV